MVMPNALRRLMTVALCIVTAVVVLFAANCLLAPKDLSSLFLQRVRSRFDVPRLRNEIVGSTLRVIAGPGFLKLAPEPHRGRIVAELGRMFPGFVVLGDQDYSEFLREFRTKGVDMDALEIIGDIWTTLGVPKVRLGDRLYSTSGRGFGNVSERSYWWFLPSAMDGDIVMRGTKREGVKRLDPYRLLPSNPDYVPIGRR